MRTTEPTRFTQGEKLEWTKAIDDHSSADYDLAYRFRGVGPGFDAAATADGENFSVSVAGTVTANCLPGAYQWQAWLTDKTDATKTFMHASGSVEVVKGFTAGETGNVDLRSNARKILDAIDAALLVDAASSTVEYEISTPAGSRKVKKSRSEAIEQRKYYAKIVAREKRRERIRNGGSFMTPILGRHYDD